VNAFIGLNLQRDKVPIRRADNQSCSCDLHQSYTPSTAE
jgi:hypothetical protein